MAKKAAKHPIPAKDTFVEEVETLVSKGFNPKNKPAVGSGDSGLTKADVIRRWFAEHQNLPWGDVTWSSVKGDVEKFLIQHHKEYKEGSDIQTWTRIGKDLGLVTVRKRGEGAAKPKETDFSSFVTDIVGSEIDAETLAAAIKIVSGCASPEVASEYAEKWKKLVELLGDEEKAQEAIQLIG